MYKKLNFGILTVLFLLFPIITLLIVGCGPNKPGSGEVDITPGIQNQQPEPETETEAVAFDR